MKCPCIRRILTVPLESKINTNSLRKPQKFNKKITSDARPQSIKIYQGTQHAFFNEKRPSYNKDAAEDAWMMTLAFFNKYLKGTQ